MEELCVIAVLFNPVKYHSLVRNYFIFRDTLLARKIPLITIELSFDGEYSIPIKDDVHRLSAKALLFQKERLINYAFSLIKDKYKYFAWIDADVLFSKSSWYDEALLKLQNADVVQLFRQVFFLPPRVYHPVDPIKYKLFKQDGIIWQYKTFTNWLERRKKKELPFTHPGFAWAARTELFYDIGLYDRHILGSGDTFIVDCLLNSFDVHYWKERFTEYMKQDSKEWKDALTAKKPTVDYINVDIFHLWHGTLNDRQYLNRHKILYHNDFDPRRDIKLENNVYEWASDKPQLHEEVLGHFINRKEDVE